MNIEKTIKELTSELTILVDEIIILKKKEEVIRYNELQTKITQINRKIEILRQYL